MIPEEVIPIICDALDKRPLSEPQDIIKLLYQREFGPGHAIKDPDSARRFLFEEYTSVTQEEGLPFEFIGNGRLRLDLSHLDHNGISPEIAARLFIESANAERTHTEADRSAFALMLRELAENGLVVSLLPSLPACVERYTAAGCPAVHHSESYRNAYSPAYRVISGALLLTEKYNIDF